MLDRVTGDAMTAIESDALAFYSRPGLMTDPGDRAPLLAGLPADVAALCKVVQNVQLHIFWAERMGLPLSEERQQEVGIREVVTKLARIVELDDRPLAEPRPLERRLVGNCRDFTVLLTAILRHQGVPARARCGFGTYFLPGHYEDHWICEVWHPAEARWARVDSQLDAFQRGALGVDFDPLDLPPGRFLTGGDAWQLCRSGQADPDLFGIFDMHGLWFIRGNLVRDFLALLKIEILPWDCWGIIDKDEAALTAEDLALLDRLAELTAARHDRLSTLQALYEADDRLRMPADWPG
jgi:hypothetical protein